MSTLENAKTYTGNHLETIFFRPMLQGPSAQELGVRVLYNMPVPTTVQMWDRRDDVLQKFTSAGWSGGTSAKKLQKTIRLDRVKAEMGYSAADYFSLIYEQIVNRAGGNMEDLSGTELEEAETTLFKQAIAEAIRGTMWVGDTTLSTGLNTFDGFLKSISELCRVGTIFPKLYTEDEKNVEGFAVSLFDALWKAANPRLQDLKAESQLAYFVTTDIYESYEKHLDKMGTEGAYSDTINGHKTLMYHGIPIVDIRIGSYLNNLSGSGISRSFCLLTDRRNLALAVNTADFPGTEVRMWYNPDEMENRQRAIFMAGCEVLDENLVSYGQLLQE